MTYKQIDMRGIRNPSRKNHLAKQLQSSNLKLQFTTRFMHIIKPIALVFSLIALLVLIQSGHDLFAQIGGSGSITGTITDAGSGETLPGANIMIQGTSMGAASDMKGHFVISKVPPGRYTLVVTYIGFKEKEAAVQVTPGAKIVQNFELEYVGITGETIVVTAQAEGQMQAINTQLSSRTIKNVVSAARIQELPDESAAAALSRLPGLSLQEGDKVVIRGLQAKMNTVLINQVKLF